MTIGQQKEKAKTKKVRHNHPQRFYNTRVQQKNTARVRKTPIKIVKKVEKTRDPRYLSLPPSLQKKKKEKISRY